MLSVKHFVALGILGAVAWTGGCSRNNGGESVASWKEVRSELARDKAPNVSSQDLHGFVEREVTFALELFQQARRDLQVPNPVYSPLSVWVALAMTYAGATDESAEEMAQVLQFVGVEDRVHVLMDAVLLGLDDGATHSQQADPEFDFSLADSVWLHVHFNPAQKFLDTLAQYYGAGLYLVDFLKDPTGAVKAINKWIAQQTHDRIRDALKKGSVDGYTKLVLVNTLYFKGRWERPFAEENTEPRPFFLEDGSEVSADTMEAAGDFRYAEVAGTQLVELTYKGGDFSLLAIMPPKGTDMDTFLSSLDATAFQSLLGALTPTSLVLYFPKIQNELNVKLDDVLYHMGIRVAFSQMGDFLAMSADGVPLRIQHVFHQTFFDLDEDGTEAAAATEVVVGDAGMAPGPPSQPKVVRFDHPFLFFLREKTHGILLFAGLLEHP